MLIPPDILLCGTVVVLRFGVGVLLLSLFGMDSFVSLQLPPSGVFARYCRVEFPWRFLSLCCNRTGTFLVAGFYLITYDLWFVILLANLLGRLTCISLFVLCFSSLVFGLVLHRGCWCLLLGVGVVLPLFFAHRLAASLRPLG